MADLARRAGVSLEEARFFLEATAGDVAAAEALAAEAGRGGVGGAGGWDARDGGADGVVWDDDTPPPPQRRAHPRENGGGALGALLGAPFALAWVGFRLCGAAVGLTLSAFDIVGGTVLPAPVMSPIRAAARAIRAAAGPADPDEAARRFVEAYRARYPDQDGAGPLPFAGAADGPAVDSALGLRPASTEARRRGRFLLIVLLDLSDPACDRLARGPLANVAVRDALRQNFILWGGDPAASWDARQAHVAVGRPVLPFVAMLAVQTTARGGEDELQLCASWEGPDVVESPEVLLGSLMESLERFASRVEAPGDRAAALAAERDLRAEQDAALAAALAADAERELARDRAEPAGDLARANLTGSDAAVARENASAEAAAAAEAEAAAAVAAAASAQAATAERATLRRRRAAALPPEIEPGSPGGSEMRVRLPGGGLAARRFPAGSTIDDLYLWADTLEVRGEGGDDAYELVQSYPRCVLERGGEPGARTLEEAGLAPRAALFAQSKVE